MLETADAIAGEELEGVWLATRNAGRLADPHPPAAEAPQRGQSHIVRQAAPLDGPLKTIASHVETPEQDSPRPGHKATEHVRGVDRRGFHQYERCREIGMRIADIGLRPVEHA